MPELDDAITRLIKGGDYKLEASAEADPYAEMETTYKERRREPPSISVGGKEVKLEAPPEPPVSPFDVARGRRDLAMKAADAATEKARLEAGVEASAAERMKSIAGQARQLEEPPRFTPTPEDKATMVGMFGLLGAMAAFVGGGKQYGNALSAMNAMGGMLAGYNQGRKDLFEKDKQIYDKKVAENKAHNDYIKQLINTAMEEAKYDYAKAKANLKLKLAEVDAPVIKAQVDQKTLEDLRTDVEKADLAYTNNLKAQAEIIRKMESGLTTKGAPLKVKGADGKTYYADREGKPLLDKEGKPLQAAETRSAAAETRYSFNVAESMGQAIRDLENVQALPRDSVLGNFAGLTGEDAKGMIDGLKKAFARNITDEDNRVFEQVIGGLEANLARALGGGYASSTTAKNIQAYRAQVAREGDTPMAKAIFLARIRQELDTLADFFEARPGAESFVPVVKKYQKIMQDAVPFTVKDVITARNELQTLPIGTERGTKASAPTPAPKAGKPTLQQFIEKAKPLNPNMTDQQLIDYYNQTYGAK